MNDKKKMTKGQIVKLCFCILGAALVIMSAITGMFHSWLPKPMTYLPFPCLIAGIAILVVIKTTSKPFMQVIPPPTADEDENTQVSEQENEPCDKEATSELQQEDIVKKD